MAGKKRVLCVGGSGFIGSNLAFALHESGKYECTHADLWSAKLRIRFENQPYSFVEADITKDHGLLDELVQESDIVFNLASKASPLAYVQDPLEVVRLNLFNGYKIIESCARHGKYAVHFSTSEVYGKSLGSPDPFREDETNCVAGPIRNHRWIYACTKQLLDRMIYAHGAKKDLDFTIVRPFNVVGPLIDHVMEDPEDGSPRVFSHFMSSLLNGDPIRLVDGGQSRRTFIHIDDLVSALILILENRDRMNGEIVNIGNPANEVTISDLADQMVAIFSDQNGPDAVKSNIVSVPAEEFYGVGYEDTDRRMPDISKMKALGWTPNIGLEDLLRETMEFTQSKKDVLTQKGLDAMAAKQTSGSPLESA